MKKQFIKRRAKTPPKKKVTLRIILEKLDAIFQRLDIIEEDLRELKGVAHPRSEQEKEPTEEFFMER
ncbi:MAG: hypothetical protein ACM3SR_09130 [Ignavibacteriales bacterium]